METISAAERRALRAKAHHLHPVVSIGAHGLTDAVLHEIDVALKAHELIKIRVWSDVRADRNVFLERICRALDCAPVQHLGKLLIVWRRNPDLKPDAPATKASSPARDPTQRRRPAATSSRREATAPRSRAAPPSGSPRAPSRRRRTGGFAATPDSRASDRSRRRRRAH